MSKVEEHMSLNSNDVEQTQQGTVFKKSQGYYTVNAGGRTVLCTLSSRLRKQLVYSTNNPSSVRRRVVAVEDIGAIDPVAIGDVVRFSDGSNGSGMITEVLPRRSALARRAAGRKPLEQVIVANVDQIVAVFAAAQPSPKWELVDRYLAGTESAGLPAVVCMTKLDLVTDEQIAPELETYRRIGYASVLTSAMTGMGIEQFKDVLQDRVSVFVGPSGVGKTTLLNAIQPGLGLRVNEVSRYSNKGKHTTTYLEMFSLDTGGSIVDTPGMREFALWDIENDDLASLFPEMRPYLGRCRFGLDCSHSHEPGCAIKEAVEVGEITARRYQSYLRMKDG